MRVCSCRSKPRAKNPTLMCGAWSALPRPGTGDSAALQKITPARMHTLEGLSRFGEQLVFLDLRVTFDTAVQTTPSAEVTMTACGHRPAYRSRPRRMR